MRYVLVIVGILVGAIGVFSFNVSLFRFLEERVFFGASLIVAGALLLSAGGMAIDVVAAIQNAKK